MVLARNVRVGRNEIDLIVADGPVLVAVEVKTRLSGGDPMSRVDEEKLAGLRRAMRRLDPAPRRLDVVTVVLGKESATVRWVKGVG